VELKINLELIN